MVNHTSTGNHYLDVIGYFEFWPSMALAIVALSCFGVAGIIVSVVRQLSSDFCSYLLLRSPVSHFGAAFVVASLLGLLPDRCTC